MRSGAQHLEIPGVAVARKPGAPMGKALIVLTWIAWVGDINAVRSATFGKIPGVAACAKAGSADGEGTYRFDGDGH